jgi:hypothetical protein
MHRHFTLDMPAGRFARNTLIASLLGMVPLLGLYIALTPGFAAQLLGGGDPLWRFVRQVLTNGLPVVFAVNYAGFLLFALGRRVGAPRTPHEVAAPRRPDGVR